MGFFWWLSVCGPRRLTIVRRVPSRVSPGRSELAMGTTAHPSLPMAAQIASAVSAFRTASCVASLPSGMGALLPSNAFCSYNRPALVF